MQKNKISANEAWKEIIKKYDIINRINENGIFHIKASEIKEFKELVSKLHQNGMEVILDVVYNHTAEGGIGGEKIQL